MDFKQVLSKLQTQDAGDKPAGAGPQRAPLIEIFHSIQGEGRFVGVPMTFLRLATCPLRCLYCDTPNSYVAPARVPVRFGPREQHEPNPVAADRAAELVRQCSATNAAGSRAQRVSVTGGEPLVFPAFVREFGRAVRDKGIRLHLETAAIDPDALSACIDQVDHLSADYKLPETLGTPTKPELVLAPGKSYGPLHRRCIEIAMRRGASVDVKIVLTDRVTDASLEQALQELQGVRDKILLVLQPVTPFGDLRKVAAGERCARWAGSGLRRGANRAGAAGVTGWKRARGCGRMAERVPGGPEPPLKSPTRSSRAGDGESRELRHGLCARQRRCW